VNEVEIRRPCSTHGKKRNTCRMLGKAEGRPRCKWMGNNNMNFGEMGWSNTDFNHLTQDRYWWRPLVDIAINFWVP
jgi:hypothetical protein